MEIRAESDSKFMLRFLLIAVMLLGYALWSLYDGFVAYPKEMKRAEAFYSAEMMAMGETDRAERWQVIAQENDWKRSKPKKPDEVQGLIYWQYGMAFMCTLIGVPMLIKYLRSRGAWIGATDQGLQSSGGETVPFDAITQVDKTRWAKKGIARVHYNQDGSDKVFVLDDFKFLRDPMGNIMQLLEQKIDASLVTGGPLESEAAAAKDETESAAPESEQASS